MNERHRVRTPSPAGAGAPRPARRGRLKVFLSYAPGAGKTYRMLEEAQELKAQQEDIVVGYFEPHARKDTIAKSEGLEFVPRRRITYRGKTFEEMDADAVLARAPAVCAVDEFAHTNVPGSSRSKRWEDVLALLEADIDVLTTLNIQHLESLHDQVLQVTGVNVRETVPDWVVKQADEIVLVDVTAEALINRLKRGVVYEPAKAEKALQHFFRQESLVALREMALRQAAHQVEVRHEPPHSSDRLLIHVTDHPATAMLIRRGRRVADYLRAECFAAYVSADGGLDGVPPRERDAAERHLDFARNLHIEARILHGRDEAAALVDFARRERITQVFVMNRRARPRWFVRGSIASRILQLAADLQVTVVAERARNTA